MKFLRFMAALLVVNVCAATAAHADVLNRGNRVEPATLDPAKTRTQYERTIVGDLFEGLVTYSADGRLVPGLAAAWQIEPGGLRYQFRLQPGIVWSDGSPITADDVVFSLRRLLDPKVASPVAQLLYVIKNARSVNTGALPVTALGVTAYETDTVIIDLEAPAPYFLQVVANAFAGVVPRKVVEKAGDAWTKPENMVVSGAFTLKSWQPNEKIELAKNPKFHDAKSVKLDGVNYIPSGDLAAAVTRFKAGELDMQIEFPAAQIDTLRETLGKEIRLTPALLTYYLAVNTSNSKLADARVRRALSLAIDRDVIADKVLRTGERAAASFVPPAVANYTPVRMDFVTKGADERLAEARKLLADAGYTGGKVLRVRYSHSNNQELRRLGVVIAGMWKRVGVEVQLHATESASYFADLRQGDFEVGAIAWLADFNDAVNFLGILQSTSVATNYSRYRDNDYDGWLARAAKEPDATAREGLLKQAEQRLLVDQPVIPLYFGATKNLIAQTVSGWQPNPLDIHLSRYLDIAR
jgi:oligopeptide transport system substrate-binding protein